MKIVHRTSELRSALATAEHVGFVPTMGNLHRGHLSLVKQAKDSGGLVVASIFVNRLQFGPGEDFDRYPRTLARDCEHLASAGCDIVFSPDDRELYPEEQTYRLHPPSELADILEGQFRPGFFVGVCTVVLKLLNIVKPAVAVFGKKDYQQLLIIQRMAGQLSLDIEVEAGETSREPDGLALSSRNGYLSDEQRRQAPELFRELLRIEQLVRSGERDFGSMEASAIQSLKSAGWIPDYIAVRRRVDLGIALEHDGAPGSLVVLGAARLGNTRLIDNIEI